MIPLGLELAPDPSTIAAVTAQPGSTAPVEEQGEDLFNAMLGQLMGHVQRAPDAGAPQGLEATPDQDSDDTESIDVTELVNPLLVDGTTPPSPTPVATMVWAIPVATASTPLASATPELASLELAGPEWTAPVPRIPTETPTVEAKDGPPASLPVLADVPTQAVSGQPDAFAAVDSPAGMPPPIAEPPSSFPDELIAQPGQPERGEAAVNPAPVQPQQRKAVDTQIVAPLAAPEQAKAADAPPEAANRNPRAEIMPQVAEAVSRQERPTRAPKQDKAPVEPKLDPAGIRPLPMAAIERAYAGNEQGSSKSFDAPREQAPPAAAPTTSPAAVAPTFAVPVEGRAMLNTPLATTVTAVGVPASVARDIDTHVPAQIVHSIRLQANHGGGEAIIRLNPNYLGEVVVAVKVEQGSVTASLQADTPAVRQWAERNESVLRQALAEQGLQLDKLTVTEKASETESDSGQDSAQDDAREQHSQQQQPRRRRRQSDDATFEVTV